MNKLIYRTTLLFGLLLITGITTTEVQAVNPEKQSANKEEPTTIKQLTEIKIEIAQLSNTLKKDEQKTNYNDSLTNTYIKTKEEEQILNKISKLKQEEALLHHMSSTSVEYLTITKMTDDDLLALQNTQTSEVKSINTPKDEPILETTSTENEPIMDMTPEIEQQPINTVSIGADGLIIESNTPSAQHVINLLLSIPGHCNGQAYHYETGLDEAINNLTIEEAIYVIHRIEGAGFGQTGDGYAGQDSPESHAAFLNNQLNRRYGGSIHQLLKEWGTYSYGGY